MEESSIYKDTEAYRDSISTVDKDGNPNLSPFSCYNFFGVNPTTLIFSPARRGRDNTTKHTFENVQEVPEVVLSAVTYDMVQQMSLSSTEYEKGVTSLLNPAWVKHPAGKLNRQE